MRRKRALVTGVGPGTGTSIVRRFAEGGYDVAMVARSEDRLRRLEAEIERTKAFSADVTDSAGFDKSLDCILADFGPPEVVIHNAVGGVFGSFMQIDPAALLHNFQVNVMALLHLARRFAPAMIEAGAGAIVASGNPSALRGKSNFAGFAPTKAGQRILAESIARELGPKGIHVAYVVIDAVIDLEWTRALRPMRRTTFSFGRPISPMRSGTSFTSQNALGPSTRRFVHSGKAGERTQIPDLVREGCLLTSS